MLLLSLFSGIPTTKESEKRDWESYVRQYKNKSFWVFGSWHEAWLVQKIIPSGMYKGLVGVYHYHRKPKTSILKIKRFIK